MRELYFRSITAFCLLFTLYISFKYNFIFFILLVVFSSISFIEYFQLLKKIKTISNKYLYLIAGVIYLFFVNLLLISSIDNFKVIIFYFIIICICTDIGGLTFGKIFKGKKLTSLSPKKTFSGLYGSFIFSFAMMFVLMNMLNLNLYILSIFTFSVCLLSQIGDIFFSYLKRQARVKDTGKLLPGHGGILDRIDGVIISVPINFIVYILSQ